MRYTTLIDISEFPAIYRNPNARLVYLHLALKSGYHDDDRDQIRVSFRGLSVAVGLSVSATRHALQQLTAAGLISKQGDVWSVKKWIIETPPTPRPRKAKDAKAEADGNIGERYQKEIEDYRQKLNEALRQMNKTEVEEWLDELKAGVNKRHHGAYINPNQRNIEWLTNVISKL